MSLVIKELRDGICIIKMNSPKNMNALDRELREELISVMSEAAKDPEVKAVILAAEGKGFCAGGDLGAMYKDIKTKGGFDATDEDLVNVEKLAECMRTMDKPVIAAVHGAAAGAGASLAFAADFTVASPESKYIMAFVNVGLVPDTGGMFWLVRALGYKRATELAMLGEPIDAETALEYGLINKIVPREELLDEAVKLAKKLKNKPVDSVRFIKEMVNEMTMKDFWESMAAERKGFLYCMETDNFKEGVSAFVEKRKPEFNK
ncbi:MAG: enoyl-CoA hydratase/isomerase family protein [Clostridia bacterium]|nr:enoyl-CoA hydratase/isomerase family protein [Clostridia bacterium]